MDLSLARPMINLGCTHFLCGVYELGLVLGRVRTFFINM